MDPHGHHQQQYERLRAAATARPLPRWGIALLALFIGPIAFLVRGARQELWDGGDHLLVVDNSSYSERYRRIRYQDVEVLQSWKSRDYLAPLLLLTSGAVLYLALAVWLYEGDPERVLLAGPALIFGLGLILAAIVHGLRGPTSCVRLRTRVQTLSLPALGRHRVAARILPMLRERILAAQDASPEPGTTSPPDPEPSAPSKTVG